MKNELNNARLVEIAKRIDIINLELPDVAAVVINWTGITPRTTSWDELDKFGSLNKELGALYTERLALMLIACTKL